ncbi:hypothetical protein RB653_007270 [Dictyostelium firmibasis]|uniref:Uncharacterized protein n=1 Tax=Dictyostelium firmibasis TaxID=79012 RepID=A0AAN7TNC9_9MYCE
MTILSALTKLGSIGSYDSNEKSSLISNSSLKGDGFGNNEVTIWPFHRRRPVVVINNRGERT